MLKVRADELFTNGVTEIVGHGVPYPFGTDSATGWYPFGTIFSSFLSPRNPLWPYLKPLTGYVTRMQAVLRATENVVPVALYRDRVGYQPSPAGEPAPEPELEANLARAGYDFDPVNAEGLMKSRVANGSLLTPGGVSYQVLVVPHAEALRAGTAERIASLAQAGLPVVFVGAIPHREEGYNDWQRRGARVVAAMQSIATSLAPVANDSEVVHALATQGIPPGVIFLEGTYTPFIEKRLGRRKLLFVRNPDPGKRRIVLQFPATARISAWDAWNGTVEDVPSSTTENAERVDIELARSPPDCWFWIRIASHYDRRPPWTAPRSRSEWQGDFQPCAPTGTLDRTVDCQPTPASGRRRRSNGRLEA